MEIKSGSGLGWENPGDSNQADLNTKPIILHSLTCSYLFYRRNSSIFLIHSSIIQGLNFSPEGWMSPGGFFPSPVSHPDLKSPTANPFKVSSKIDKNSLF